MNTRIALTIGIPAHPRVTPAHQSIPNNPQTPGQYPVSTPNSPSTDVNQHYTVDINDALVACYVPAGYVVYDIHGRTRKT